MPLHLITGRANAGKTGVINRILFESLERGEAPSLLVPTVADVRRAVVELSAKTPVGVRVASLSNWAEDLWTLHGDGRRIVGSAARAAFVARAIETADLGMLDDVADTMGFARLVGKAVELSGDPSEVALAGNVALRDLAQVVRVYESLIAEAGLIEATRARHILTQSPPRLPGAVCANRFAFYSASEIALLTGLSACNEVAVALLWERGYAPTASIEGAYERFSAAATTTQAVAEPLRTGEIARVLDGLFAGPAETRSGGEVGFGLAHGRLAEAELVAGAVAEAIWSGTPEERIVIAYPRLVDAAGPLDNALVAHGIAHDVDIARPVGHTAVGRTVSELLDLSLGRVGRTTAHAVISGPCGDVSIDHVARLDREWRQKRVEDPRALLESIGRVDALIGRAALDVAAIGPLRLDSETGKKWQDILDALLSTLALREHVDPTAGIGADATRMHLGENAAACRAIAACISEMASIENAPFTGADLREALRRLAIGGTSGEHHGRVQVTELHRIGSRRFDFVVLGGLSAGELPIAAPDSIAAEIRSRFGADVDGLADDRARLEFYHVISRARYQLFLARRDADDSGNAVRGSVLWDELLDAYRAAGDDSEDWPVAAPAPLRLTAADIAEFAPVFSQGARAARRKAVRGIPRRTRARSSTICDPDVLEALAAGMIFSATEIETYLQCPYRWFYERVLRPEEIDVEVDARSTGTLAHSILAEFYRRLPETVSGPRVVPDVLPKALRLLDAVVAESDAVSLATGLSERLNVERAVRWVRNTVNDDATILPGFMPVAHEFGFGGDDMPQVELGGVRFHGRIDRIDISEGAACVNDYKSSSSLVGRGRFIEKGKVQAVVYALAAGQAFDRAIAGSVYRSLRTRKMRGFWRPDLLHTDLRRGDDKDAVTDLEFGELIEATTASVAEAVARLRAGEIPRRPREKASCQYCALSVVCTEAIR